MIRSLRECYLHQKINGVAKKIDKLREFWKHGINPVTGWRPLICNNVRLGIPIYRKNKTDQASKFKPRGFH